MDLTRKYNEIIGVVLKKPGFSSSAIHSEISGRGGEQSLVTTKRILGELRDQGLLKVIGTGRSTAYEVSTKGRVFADIEAGSYCAIDPDKRYGSENYSFDLFTNFPIEVFSSEELNKLNLSTTEYKNRLADTSEVIEKKELERLVIELSWKSSKIEGNTYTLLDTEKLILEDKEAKGHDRNEARMILNHKEAFSYVYKERDRFATLSRSNLEDLHSMIVRDMGVSSGLRKSGVGVLGSKYKPLDNVYQITDAVNNLSELVGRLSSPYAKAMVALLGISYIQPFEDGNKRTARIMANAVLLAHGRAPLSYRSVSEEDYRAATLVFYEINSIIPFKKIFIEQYEFAASNYAVR